MFYNLLNFCKLTSVKANTLDGGDIQRAEFSKSWASESQH